jgi:hypothetical protein
VQELIDSTGKHVYAEDLQEALDRVVGETGAFPYGKADATDEGELRMALAADHANAIIRIEFGKPVAWLGLPVREARELADKLIVKAAEVEGRKV